MSTTVSDYFTSASSSGTGQTWSNTSGIATGSATYCELVSPVSMSFTDLMVTKPQALDGVPDGSRFESMEVSFYDKLEGVSGNQRIRFEGGIGGVYGIVGTRYSHTASSGYILRTYSGDATYWGLGAYDAKDILKALRDGTLKMRYEVSLTGTQSLGDKASLDDVFCEVTYTEVDTKRAALLPCVP